MLLVSDVLVLDNCLSMWSLRSWVGKNAATGQVSNLPLHLDWSRYRDCGPKLPGMTYRPEQLHSGENNA
jgi:hypothetical protein